MHRGLYGATKTGLSDGSRSGYEAKIRKYRLLVFGAKPVHPLDGEELKDYFLTTLVNIRKPNGGPYLKPTGKR